MNEAKRIDVHHHILPAEYVDRVGYDNVGAQGSSGRVPAWSIQDALEGMDKAGISTAITSVSSPGLVPLNARDAVDAARWCNEFAAAMTQQHPGRFGMFATVAAQDMDAALNEATRAFDELAADGICLLSNYNGTYLGDQDFHPLYEELNRRKAVVFVHPTSPRDLVRINALSASTLEFPFDTTRTVASLIFGGVINRFPDIKWIFSHAGGAIPYLSGRVEVLSTNNPALREHIPNGFAAELAKLYFDCALSANQTAIAAMASVVTMDRILFGTDYPFGPKGQMSGTVDGLKGLGLAADELQKIGHGNALKLFPRFA
ncbi:MAG: amidohydrolase family protein [Pseudomonadota bacterium]